MTTIQGTPTMVCAFALGRGMYCGLPDPHEGVHIPTLTSRDPLNLGYEVGTSHRIWTGGVDTVLGYDAQGWVWVRDRKTFEVRRHLTAKDIGGDHPRHTHAPATLEDRGTFSWCLDCDGPGETCPK